VLGRWSAQAGVRSVAVSKLGRRILAGLASRQAWLLDGHHVRRPVIIPHAEAVRAVDIGLDAATRQVLVAVTSGQVLTWPLG